MRVAHLLRKYNPAEWGGTETAVKRLLEGLSAHGVSAVLFAPTALHPPCRDPLAEAGFPVKRFRAFLPIARISAEQRRQLVAVGGNLMSFDLFWKLLREPNLSAIHSHALNRLGGVGRLVARIRRIPFVVTIHGGWMDLPDPAREALERPRRGGWEWGKIFGLLLRSRQVVEDADAVLTCNKREAALLQERYPAQTIRVQPHAVSVQRFSKDCRPAVPKFFPSTQGKQTLLTVGRIDPVKNQLWLVQRMPEVLGRHPDALLVLVGACTDEAYGKALKKEALRLGLESNVLLTGGLHPEDERLIGLLQSASAVLIPSVSETFGLMVLEAWAAGTPVLATRTSGVAELIRHRETGWLFDVGNSEQFHAALDEALNRPDLRRACTEAARNVVAAKYDATALAAQMKQLYEDLVARSIVRHGP